MLGVTTEKGPDHGWIVSRFMGLCMPCHTFSFVMEI